MVDLAIGQQVRIKSVDEICDEFSIPHPCGQSSLIVNECTITQRAQAFCGGTYTIDEVDDVDDMVYIQESDWWWPVEVIDDMRVELSPEAWLQVALG